MNNNPLRILKETELEELSNALQEQFGIKNIPGLAVVRGKEKVFLFTGNISQKDLLVIENNTFIEKVGTYIATKEERGYRLSIEGSQIFKNQITKNIVELDKEEMETWMHGSEVLKETGFKGYVIIKYEEDMLGTGNASEQKITNFIPKSRRLKYKQN